MRAYACGIRLAGGWLFANRAMRLARRDMANTPPRARYLRYAGATDNEAAQSV